MELIDRNGLWEKVFSYPFGWSNEDVISELKIAPTIDAVPVVRCGECIFATPFPSDVKPILCGNGQACRKNTTDFCSYGEPRTP